MGDVSMNLQTLVGTGLLASALLSAGALATPVFVGHIAFTDSYGSIGGGEFQAYANPLFNDFTLNPVRTGTAFQNAPTAPQPGHFETFCVEKFEPLYFFGDASNPSSNEYKADLNTETVAQAAAYAGGAHGGFNDPLDPMTAYLYDHFLHMTLTTPYDYGTGAQRINDADALQTAIWFIEQEDSTPLTGKALALWTEANNAVTSGAWTGLGNVRILNIYTNSTRVDYQDVLVETITSVPLPGGGPMAAAGLAGLVGLVGIRRRFR
jgi:hypothetical protein